LTAVVLAHHADDQAETVMQRLLRGSGVAGLRPMRPDSVIGGLRIVRPLLAVRRATLRTFLREHGVAWREDWSNAATINSATASARRSRQAGRDRRRC
jgi:tRNA(Ile)-lysidine synthase